LQTLFCSFFVQISPEEAKDLVRTGPKLQAFVICIYAHKISRHVDIIAVGTPLLDGEMLEANTQATAHAARTPEPVVLDKPTPGGGAILLRSHGTCSVCFFQLSCSVGKAPR
jgi:hypothetical protein